MADILYVIDGYVDPNYVVATRDASATFISNSTGQWQDMGTWEEPGQEVWQPFIATAISQQGFASTTLSATSSITSSANVSVTKTLNVSSSISVIATLLGDGATIKVSSGTLTVDADLTGTGVSTINGVSQLAIIGNHIENASSILQSNTSLTVSAIKTQQINVTMVSAAQLLSAATVGVSLVFQSQVTLQSVLGVTGTATLNSTSNISVVAVRIRNAQSQLSANSTVSSTGGTNTVITVTLPAVTSSLATLIAYSVDPERILRILSESRINMITEETRAQQILSETRNLVVQHTQLVDIAGTPIDRREG